MASLDQLKGTFFDECSEALQQIELGLSDLREGAASDDTINAVFRSVHSVKGGAGIFGFDDLVKFAHVFETVLDAMRSGKLARQSGHRRHAVAGERCAVGFDRYVAIRRSNSARSMDRNAAPVLNGFCRRTRLVKNGVTADRRRPPISTASISCRSGPISSIRWTSSRPNRNTGSSSGPRPTC